MCSLKQQLFLLPVPKQVITMRKEKKKETDSMHVESLSQETDQAIIDQINKRNDENQALKKLLDNLNTSFPTNESKSSKSDSKNE
jgi:hypothetical protein